MWKTTGIAALLVLAAALPANAQPQEGTDTTGHAEVPEDYAFTILRNGNEVGEHLMSFERTDEGLVADISIGIKVSFGPIPLYRYNHTNREVWQDGRLVSIETETKENGKTFSVSGEAQDGQFFIDGTAGELTAGPGIIPTSYWRREIVESSPLLDSQRGRLLEMNLDETYTDEETGSECHALTGDIDLTLCYSGERLTGLDFKFKNSHIEYRPKAKES